MLQKTLASPLDNKEIKPVNAKGKQSWIFIVRTDAEVPILWPRDVKCQLTGKDSDAGRDWGQEEKGTTEDGMAGWHHRLDGHEFKWTLGVGDGQGGLECCSPWRRKESDTTERLNWTEVKDEIVGWHHWLNGHEFEQTLRQWRSGKPGVLQSMGWQRIGHEWTTEQQNTLTLYLLLMLNSNQLYPVGAYSSWLLSPFTRTYKFFISSLLFWEVFSLYFLPYTWHQTHSPGSFYSC